ncbi:DUF2188 domain-containing protein [Streptomyces sp. NPDC047141]|uniref:DUF2188 domain-containing protein n=3 Tax=unclassified Streptomyces TaxID=2593676 RepID=UPI0033DD5DAA
MRSPGASAAPGRPVVALWRETAGYAGSYGGEATGTPPSNTPAESEVDGVDAFRAGGPHPCPRCHTATHQRPAGHSPVRPFVAPCAAADPRLHGALGSRGTRSGPPPQTYAGRQRASTQQGVGLCSRCLGIHAQGKATGDHPAVLARALMPLRRSGTHVDRHTAGPRLRAAPSAQRLCVDRQRARRTIMATKRTVYHVAPSADRAAAAGLKWQVEGREGRRLLHEPHHTQREAIDSARRHAKAHLPAQVVVHARDGHVRTAYAYGEASEAPRGERGRRAGARGGIF